MRIDKYLKNARIIKRRTIAKEACEQGRVLVNGKSAKPGTEVSTGDVIEIIFGTKPMKIKVEQMLEHVIKDDYKDNIQLKEIISLIDDKPILNKEQIYLIKFLRDNYLCTYLDAYKVMMPTQLKLSKNINNIKTEKKYYIKNIKEVNAKAEQNILNLFKDKDYLKPSEI